MRFLAVVAVFTVAMGKVMRLLSRQGKEFKMRKYLPVAFFTTFGGSSIITTASLIVSALNSRDSKD